MDLLARLRPRWRHPDPAVRLAAVRDMRPGEQERLGTIATGDPDVRVRRAAIERLDDPELLARIATGDSDHALRQLAGERGREALVRIACSDGTIEDCEAALARTTEAHGLAAIAVGAAHEGVRRAALARVSGDRVLRDIVRNAGDPVVRQDALDRIEDAAILRSFVLGDGPRDLAARALERLRDADALRMVASSRTVAKTLRERAHELLGAHADVPSPLGAREARARQLELCTTVHMLRSRRDVLEAARRVRDAQREWDELARATEPRADVAAQFAAACEAVLRDATSAVRRQAELDRARTALAEGLAARAALCERVEALEGPDLEREVTEARQAWKSLAPLAGDQAATLQQRFSRACEHAAARDHTRSSAETQRATLETLVAEAEELGSAPQPPAAKAWQALEDRWETRTRAGDAAEALSQRFAAARQRVQRRREEADDQRTALEQKNLRRLETLHARIAEMTTSESLKVSAGRRELQVINEALADPGPLPPSERRRTWVARLTEARDELVRRLAREEQTEEWRRWANASAQEELIARVEALLEANDVVEGTRQLGQLQEEWAKVATASPDRSQALWERFRTARNELRKRCDAYQAANLEQKRALCAQVADVADSTTWNDTAELIKRLQHQWKEIGPVPARHATALWREFREPCDRFFARRKEHFDRIDGERRGNATAKSTLCERAEAMADSTDWDATAAAFKELQAEWKRVGPAPRQEADALWQRFRTACDRFFDRRNRREELERDDAIQSARAICDELDALVGALGAEPAPESDRVGAQVDAAWTAWLRLDVPALGGADELTARLHAACERIATLRPESMRGTRLDPAATRTRREKLCGRLEALVTAPAEPPAPLSPQEMALALRERLAANTIGGATGGDPGKQDVAREVERISRSWASLGPVLGEDARALADRFARALARVREQPA